jgi:hypothetical protein
METGWLGNLHTFENAYAFLGCQDVAYHPGHPLPPSQTDSTFNVQHFDIYAKDTYPKDSKSPPDRKVSVIDVNKELYYLASNLDQRAPKSRSRRPHAAHASVKPFYSEIRHCVALICRNIMLSSRKVSLPFSIGHGV